MPVLYSKYINFNQTISKLILFLICLFDLQFSRNIPTSKIIAFLKHIFQSLNVKFCKSFVNKYCRDSKQCLEDVTHWNSTRKYQNDNILYIVDEDVKTLFPSVRKLLVKKAFSFG